MFGQVVCPSYSDVNNVKMSALGWKMKGIEQVLVQYAELWQLLRKIYQPPLTLLDACPFTFFPMSQGLEIQL